MGIFTPITDYISKTCSSWFGSDEVIEPKKTRKSPDRTRITQSQYDYIVQAKKRFEDKARFLPASDRPRKQVLVDDLNRVLGLNKSYRYYQRIWSGDLKREECPQVN